MTLNALYMVHMDHVRSSPPAVPRPPETGGGPEHELAYRLRQQGLLVEFGRFALISRDLDALLQEATRLAALGLQTAFAKLATPVPSGNRLLVRAGVGWRPGVIGHASVGADLDSPAGYALHTRSEEHTSELQSREN